MNSSTVDPGPLCDVAPSLAAKLEYVILSVLMHHHGEIESSLPEWYVSLKLAFPELDDRAEVKKFFKHLWEDGLIVMKSPWIGDYTIDSGDNDLDFMALGNFTVALTTRGVDRWDRVCRYPAHIDTDTVATRGIGENTLHDALPSHEPQPGGKLLSSDSCAECLTLLYRVYEAGLGVELSKSDLNAAKERGILNLQERQLALAQARSVGRVVVQALNKHLKAHGCMAGEKMKGATG